MNAKEAREIITRWGNVTSPKANIPGDSFDQVLERGVEWANAKGYLEALQGEEVKELVGALEKIRDIYYRGNRSTESSPDSSRQEPTSPTLSTDRER